MPRTKQAVQAVQAAAAGRTKQKIGKSASAPLKVPRKTLMKAKEKEAVQEEEPQKKQHRYRPGTRAKILSRRLAKGKTLLIQKLPFERRAKEILATLTTEPMRISRLAMIALQLRTECKLHRVLQVAGVLVKNGKRKTVTEKDIFCYQTLKDLIC